MSDLIGINLVAFIAMIVVIWLLAMQRGLIKKFFGKRQTIRAILEGCLILAMAYALEEFFLLLLDADRLSDLHGAFRLSAEVVLYIGYAGFFARCAEGILFRKKAAKEDWRLSNLARGAFYCVFLLVAVAIYLIRHDITPSEVYVWTGATAAVIAFIMQQTLGDLFSGLALSLEKPFKIGDWIRLADGTEGRVEDINWRATHLRAWDKTTYVIPNATLARESFTNLYGRKHVFAPWYTVQISGEHDPAHVTQLLERAAEGCTYPKKIPAPVVRLMYADSSPYTYMVWVHFDNYPSMFAGREELYTAIDAALRAEGISIAADIQEVKLSRAPAPLQKGPAEGGAG